MFIIFGSSEEKVDFGEVEKKLCPICKEVKPFHLILIYKYTHISDTFGLIAEKRYMNSCEDCDHGQEINMMVIERQLGYVPIPFMRRYGGYVLLAIVVLWVAFFSIYLALK